MYHLGYPGQRPWTDRGGRQHSLPLTQVVLPQMIPAQSSFPPEERDDEEAESIRRRRQEHVMQHLLRIQEASDEIVSLSETMRNRHQATLATLDNIDQMAAQQKEFLRHSTRKQYSSTSPQQTRKMRNHQEDHPHMHLHGRGPSQEVTSRVSRRSRQRHRASTETLVGETMPFPLAESTGTEQQPQSQMQQVSRAHSPVELPALRMREPGESTSEVHVHTQRQPRAPPELEQGPGAPRAPEHQGQHQLPAWPITRSRSRPGITPAVPILQLRSRSKS